MWVATAGIPFESMAIVVKEFGAVVEEVPGAGNDVRDRGTVHVPFSR